MAINENREEFKVYNNVFDNFTIKVLQKLIAQGIIDGLSGIISLGKEANVFIGLKDETPFAVKIYRVKACNFNRMFDYLSQDIRFSGILKNRRKVILEWVRREYRNLIVAYQNNVFVPKPIAHRDNVIIMEFIGNKERKEPARLLKDLPPKDPEKFLKELTENYKKLVIKGKIVHGDLSEFNILNFNEHPVMIDFSQGCSVESGFGLELLKRDLEKIRNYFKKFNIEFDVDTTYKEILKKLENKK